MRCIAIILSGGTGSRMNMDIPKQYIEVGDRMIITESIRPFMECEAVSDIRIVADNAWRDRILDEYRVLSTDYKFHGFSSPGANRQLSIYNALCDIRQDISDDDLVIIHDAARPLVTVKLISECVSAVYDDNVRDNIDEDVENYDNMDKEAGIRSTGNRVAVHDGVMPVIPMKDTIYYSDDGKHIGKLINRDKVFAGQAPEVFVYGKYLEACKRLLPDKIMDIRGSTEPAIMAGMDIVMIPGDEMNFKITTREDLARYTDYLTDGRD